MIETEVLLALDGTEGEGTGRTTEGLVTRLGTYERVYQALYNLRRDGLVRNPSHGHWALTKAGGEALRALVEPEPAECPTCLGSGRIEDADRDERGRPVMRKCLDCNGTGAAA